MHRQLATSALIVVSLLTMAIDCGIDASLLFINDTDQDVWLTHQSDLGWPPDDQLRWRNIPAGETIDIGGAGGCVEAGISLIATEPDTNKVIDRRPHSRERPWCDGQTWHWSGPGDHE